MHIIPTQTKIILVRHAFGRMTAGYNTMSSQQPLLSETQALQPQPPQIVFVLPPYPPPNRHRLLRKSWRRGVMCCATFFIFLAAVVYLFWPSDPELSVVRIKFGSLQFHMHPKISLDAILDLTVRIRNQDLLYSLHYDSLVVSIGYRGKRLGDVTSAGGNILARGSSYINATLQLEGVEILSDVILLLEDLAKGEITFDTETQIGGLIRVFFIDLPLKTEMACEAIVNTLTQTVSRQSCYPEISEVVSRR